MTKIQTKFFIRKTIKVSLGYGNPSSKNTDASKNSQCIKYNKISSPPAQYSLKNQFLTVRNQHKKFELNFLYLILHGIS